MIKINFFDYLHEISDYRSLLSENSFKYKNVEKKETELNKKIKKETLKKSKIVVTPKKENLAKKKNLPFNFSNFKAEIQNEEKIIITTTTKDCEIAGKQNGVSNSMKFFIVSTKNCNLKIKILKGRFSKTQIEIEIIKNNKIKIKTF